MPTHAFGTFRDCNRLEGLNDFLEKKSVEMFGRHPRMDDRRELD